MSRRTSGGAAESDAGSWTADPLIGKVLDGRYRIEDVLGTGGVGVVYRAEHLKLQRQVAIKVLHEKLGTIDELRRRFEREGQALSALSHPNVVSVNDYGIADGMPYLVMELLEGRTLADLIDDDGPPDIEVGIDIARQILRGLAFAHSAGIVHRDLKAANVFLQTLPDAPHHVKLLDFGLAKIFTTEDGSADPTLTKSGTILGTPAYMSPEQATGSAVDERADVYSAGVLLFEILTGRYPFEMPTRADMLRAHMLEPVPDAETARAGLALTPELRGLIERAMAKERAERYDDAATMLTALDALPRPPATFDPQVASGQIPRLDPAAERRSEESTAAASGPMSTREASAPQPTVTPPLRVPRRLLPIGAVALGVLLLAAAAALVLAPDDGDDVPEPPATAAQGAESAAGAEGTTEPDEATAEGEGAESPSGSGAGGAGAQGSGAESGAAGSAAQAAAGGAASGEEAVADRVVPDPDRPPAVNPFRGPLPPSLRRYHGRVRRGRRLSPRDRRAVAQIQRSMPNDPRPSLILAHHFVDITYYSDGLDRYERAYNIDASSRGDPQMLRDLIQMAQSNSVAERASDLLVRFYGSEAIPAVERAISRTHEPAKVGLLARLRSRL